MSRFKTLSALAAAPAFLAAATLPEGRGREVVERVCTRCHTASVFAAQRHTRGEWRDIVREMQNAGAKASKADFARIMDYLAKTFPNR